MNEISILGAGVSGLTTAYLLKKKGLTAQVIEARARLGGRTLSLNSHGATLDLGAAWIWPHHLNISALVDELGIEVFPQYESGYNLFETPTEIQAFLPQASNHPKRFANGTQEISLKLAEKLKDQIRLETRICEITDNADSLELTTTIGETLQTKRLIISIPPRVFANTISFSPALPETLLDAQRKTHTWMGNSAKALVSYETAFWRKKQLSGFALSYVGPLGEIHDNSPKTASKGVIKGFFANIPSYSGNFEQRKAAVLDQLTKLFGEEAQHALDYHDYAWWTDHLSSAPKDHIALRDHPRYANPEFSKPYWENKLYFAGAETATAQGGYLDGAVEAAKRVAKLVSHSTTI